MTAKSYGASVADFSTAAGLFLSLACQIRRKAFDCFRPRTICKLKTRKCFLTNEYNDMILSQSQHLRRVRRGR